MLYPFKTVLINQNNIFNKENSHCDHYTSVEKCVNVPCLTTVCEDKVWWVDLAICGITRALLDRHAYTGWK